MESLKRNYDRVLLVAAALISLVFGGMLAMKALGLGDKFKRAESTERSEMGDSGEEAIKAASMHLDGEFAWNSPAMTGVPQKLIPLLVSVPVYVQSGREIDLLDPDSPKIRPPVDNAYIFEHRLPGGRTDLLGLDLDGDGFNTEEEWADGRTNPRDKNDHPARYSKLTVDEIKTDLYVLSYRTGENPEGDFSIREESTPWTTQKVDRDSNFTKMNKPFGKQDGHKDRYQITGFQEKMVPGGAGGAPKPAHIITISDTQGDPFTIEYRGTKVFPTHYAIFHYALPGYEGVIEGAFKEGDTFTIPGDPDTKYKVTGLTGKLEDGAKIQQLAAPGGTPKDLTIRARQKSE